MGVEAAEMDFNSIEKSRDELFTPEQRIFTESFYKFT